MGFQGLQSEFAKAIHDKQLVVMAISGAFAVADIVFNLNLTTTQLATGAGVVATYLGTSTYLAAKHAQGEHSVAAAASSMNGVSDLINQAAPLLSKLTETKTPEAVPVKDVAGTVAGTSAAVDTSSTDAAIPIVTADRTVSGQ